MSMLLLTMGPQLSISMVAPGLNIGNPGTIVLQAVGAAGSVTWTLLSSSLPTPEWGGLVSSGATATLNAANVLTPGAFTIRVRAVDSFRQPVEAEFTVRVQSLPIMITGSLSEWAVGVAASDDLAVTGGSGTYVSAGIAAGSLPAGMGVSLIGSTLRVSGTPSEEGSGSVTIWVRDSDGAEGMIALSWSVDDAGQSLWSAVNKAADIIITNAGSDVESVSGTGVGGTVVSESGHTAGKLYVEIRHVQSYPSVQAVGVGVLRGIAGVSTYLGGDSNGWGVWVDGAGGNSSTTYHAGAATNSVVVGFGVPRTARIAIDLTAGKLWFSRFGQSAWIGGGDPAAGTSPTYVFTPGGTFYFAACPRAGNAGAPSQRNRLSLTDPSDWEFSAPVGFGVWT